MSPLNIKYDSKPERGRCQPLRELRMARFFADLSQDELSRRSGIDRALISRAENGYIKLSDDQKEKIAEALGVDINTLFK